MFAIFTEVLNLQVTLWSICRACDLELKGVNISSLHFVKVEHLKGEN